MAVRVPDIAKFVGLSAPSVYQILANPDHPRYSVATKQRVLKAAEELGYQPNSAAKALSTKRTGHIGFILSDTVADGWANPYYATCLCGVEAACRKRGYGLNVSLYNLSNVDSFVFPTKVGQRSVDGLILADYVESAVVKRFCEFEIPCVCIGDYTEIGELIPTIASDVNSSFLQEIRYATSLGHQHIGIHFPTRRRDKETAETIIELARRDPALASCKINIFYTPLNAGDYSAARPLMKSWLAMPAEERPTVMIATDQTIVAFLKEMSELGLKCPDNISLISGADTRLCELAIPGITAIRYDLANLGKVAVDLLLDHLDFNKPLTAGMSRNDFLGELVIRQSCRKLSVK